LMLIRFYLPLTFNTCNYFFIFIRVPRYFHSSHFYACFESFNTI
jgi:hypothetical protein